MVFVTRAVGVVVNAVETAEMSSRLLLGGARAWGENNKRTRQARGVLFCP